MAAVTMALACAAQSYSNGYYIVNEGQYGNEPGLLIFYDKESGTMEGDVYATASGNTLGTTAQFAAVGDGKLFVCSKQHYGNTGGRLVIADAKSLRTLASYKEIDGEADTRGVCVAPALERFYVGTTAGVYAYDLASLQQLGVVEGTAIEGAGTYSPGSGDMVVAGNLLYVATPEGVQVIDMTQNRLVSTVELANTTSVFKVNGQVYAAINSSTGWGTIPGENDTEQFVPISNGVAGTPINVPAASYNPWFTPKPCAPAALADGKSIVYSCGENTSNLIKYDFSTGTYTQNFITFDSPQKMYGHVVSVDAKTGDVLACTYQSYATKNYWLNIYDATDGQLKKSVKFPTTHYWFPSMILMAPDDTATGIDGVNKAEREVIGVEYVNLAGCRSAKPFDGVNVVLTRYSDGTSSSAKMIF